MSDLTGWDVVRAVLSGLGLFEVRVVVRRHNDFNDQTDTDRTQRARRKCFSLFASPPPTTRTAVLRCRRSITLTRKSLIRFRESRHCKRRMMVIKSIAACTAIATRCLRGYRVQA